MKNTILQIAPGRNIVLYVLWGRNDTVLQVLCFLLKLKKKHIFNAKINSVKNKEELQNLKTEIFGKNGKITKEFKTLGSLDPEKRKDFASHLNKIKLLELV